MPSPFKSGIPRFYCLNPAIEKKGDYVEEEVWNPDAALCVRSVMFGAPGHN